MVQRQLRARGISDESVLRAMARIPRCQFVPSHLASDAYRDGPLPIGEGQTISQPFIVAQMTELLGVTPGDRVLELGTGSGYQTAVLAEIGAAVWTIERSEALFRSARDRLQRLGYRGVRVVHGDGTLGLPDDAPFDRILATGSLPAIPRNLLRQLSPGGLFVGPVGGVSSHSLIRITYHPERISKETFGACRFVPLIGNEGWAGSDGLAQ